MSFEKEVRERIDANRGNEPLKRAADEFMMASLGPKYSYNFSWLGLPIIQYPQDIIAMQQIVWRVQPDLIIETGIARGGSLIFYASMLELNAACGGPPDAEVLAVDIEIREQNREAIEAHPLARRIQMLEGSSIAPHIVSEARRRAAGRRTLVCLDSNHTCEHVLAELECYAPLTSIGSYCVAFDTIIEDMPASLSAGRPWGPGNNPKGAVRQYLEAHSEFEVDLDVQHQVLITVAPGGYLRRVR